MAPYRDGSAGAVLVLFVRGALTATRREVGGGHGHRAHAVASDLTPRERDVLGIMAGGASNAKICTALHLSPKTVETHVRNIFLKLDLRPDGRLDRRVVAVLAYVQAESERIAA